MEVGSHNVIWNAESFSSGIYFARISNNKNNNTLKLVLAK